MDPDWTPPTPGVIGRPTSEYLVVSTNSLVELLEKCSECSGKNNLSFNMEGMAVSCTGDCTMCGTTFSWKGSDVLKTAKASSKERLPKINVDLVTGAVISAVGGIVSSEKYYSLELHN